MTAQIIILCLIVSSLALSLAKHGEDRGEYNFWYTLIALTLEFFILKWGGFWQPLGW